MRKSRCKIGIKNSGRQPMEFFFFFKGRNKRKPMLTEGKEQKTVFPEKNKGISKEVAYIHNFATFFPVNLHI